MTADALAVVTGAGGFVATELIRQLLEQGYRVRGTVRSLQNSEKSQHLHKLPGAEERLQLVEADLLQEGSFDAALEGATFLFHTASPFFIGADDPQAQLLDPAKKGTANVLRAAGRHRASLRRVVLTSSVAAVHGAKGAAPPRNGSLYTQEDWNETSSLENDQAYWLSKVSAEREAWRLAREQGLDLVTILPNFVLGPVHSARTDSTSAGFVKGLLEGNPAGSDATICDVRDVARAHIAAATVPEASGRFIVSQPAAFTVRQIAETLQRHFPTLEVGQPSAPESTPKPKYDVRKAERVLGLRPLPQEQTLTDMADSLIKYGVAKPKQKG